MADKEEEEEEEKQNKQISIQSKSRIYKTCVRLVISYGAEKKPKDQKNAENNRDVAIRAITGNTLLDKKKNEDIKDP